MPDAPGRGLAALSGGSAMVDGHVHIFPPEIREGRSSFLARDPWFAGLYASPSAAMASAEEVVAAMDVDGVETAIVFGFAFRDQGLCRLVNDYVLESMALHPGRLAGLCCVSPQEPGAVAELERCLDAGCRGCGELAPDGQGFGAAYTGGGRAQGGAAPTGTAGMRAVAGCLTERGLPLLLHSNEPVGHGYPGKGAFTPQACVAFASAHPDLTVVFAHLGGGLFLYELMPEIRDALANVCYDTTAVPYLYRPEAYSVALACAGSDKLIFGSDYPLLPPGRYAQGLSGLAPADLERILGGNARRIYRL